MSQINAAIVPCLSGNRKDTNLRINCYVECQNGIAYRPLQCLWHSGVTLNVLNVKTNKSEVYCGAGAMKGGGGGFVKWNIATCRGKFNFNLLLSHSRQNVPFDLKTVSAHPQ